MQCLISSRRGRSLNASATCSGATSCTAGEVRPTRYAGTMLRPARNSASASCLAIRSAPRSIAVRSSHLARACGCMRATLPARSARLKKPRISPSKRANPGASRLPCACSLKSGCLHCRSSLMLLKPPLRAAIDIQVARECRCDLAWSRLVLGRVLEAKGNSAAGLAELVEAKREFEQLGIVRGIENVSAALEVASELAHVKEA